MARYDHIRLRNLGVASAEFASPDVGRKSRPTFVERRREHGQRLARDLDQLRAMFASSMERQALYGIPEKKRGSAISITSRPGQPLDVGTLKLETRDYSVLGVKLIKTRRNHDSNENETTRQQARVFYTQKGFEQLLNRLDEYIDWKPGRPRRPLNFWLFEGAESFDEMGIEGYWNDDRGRMPRTAKRAEWEVWTRASLSEELDDAMRELEISSRGNVTEFQDIAVHNMLATRAQIQELIIGTGAIVELRGASNFVARDHDIPPSLRQERVHELAARVQSAQVTDPIVTLLDTGVARTHPLLKQSLPANRCYTVNPRWDPFDSNGHGTCMAGVALFGDLSSALNSTGPITLTANLESVTVSEPGSNARLPARDALARAVNLVERNPGNRVYCLAATSVGEAESGIPTSTSATLDKLAFGDGEDTRLFCTAVGNVDTAATNPYQISQYDRLNEFHGIQSPAQSFNALSVGAATQLRSIANLVAPVGDLSPTSRTALSWDDERAHKPDIVMEGGNHIIRSCGKTSQPHPNDMVMTTGRDFQKMPITITGETSAATAAAARLAAKVMHRYPGIRPETVRGLIVNSARWTEAMEARMKLLVRRGMSESRAAYHILSCYGWGIPDEDRLFNSADNALTLLVEDTMQPYERTKTSSKLHEMKFFKLPWPDDALRKLGGTQIQVRCTLSYFAEPNPGNTSRGEHRLYAGHRLKFGFKRYREHDDDLQLRFNSAAGSSRNSFDEDTSIATDDDRWLLGRFKNRGTLHQDIWTGPAYELVDRDAICVAPNNGWWSGEAEADERIVNFSLIVTVSSPEVKARLFTETLAKVPANKLVATSLNRT
jgi:hypothetical protein